MRLPDFVNRLRRKFSEASNFVRNPQQAIYRQGRKIALQKYEQAAFPGSGSGRSKPADGAREAADTNGASRRETVVEGRSRQQRQDNRTSPSASPQALPSAPTSIAAATPPPVTKPVALDNPDCVLLRPGEVLTRGWVGRYSVGACLQDHGWMRLYEGIQENGQEAVWIYQYCLSDTTFQTRNQQARRTAFKQIIDLNARLGEGSDFRLLKLRDVIAAPQQPCYLVTKSLPGSQCLSEHLADRRQPFSPDQVRELLRQVLQSLQYLQTYQVQWPDGSTQMGLPHGHLTLESLWIRFTEATVGTQAESFFVYLSRLALWEHLFYSGEPAIRDIADNTQALGTISDDLAALGHIAFALLTRDTQADPAQLANWPDDAEARSLYPFICRLLGVGSEEPFRSPDTAIEVLRKLPPTLVMPTEAEQPLVEPVQTTGLSPWAWLVIGMALLGVGWAGLSWWQRRTGMPIWAGPTCRESEGCILKLQPFDDSVTITYNFEPRVAWQEAFSRSLANPAIRSDQAVMLEASLEEGTAPSNPSSPSNLLRSSQGVRDRQELLSQIRQGELQAGFVRGGQGDTPGIAETTVAYDGLAVFVIYSDAQRDRNVLKLIDPSISLADIRQLFTRQRQTIGKNDYPVKLYFPQGYGKSGDNAAETVALFRELVFDTTEDQAQFESVRRQVLATVAAQAPPPASIYAHMVDDFENQQITDQPLIGIGFDRISRLNGQCSVYPLTLTQDRQTYPILMSNGGPVDENTDLCADRGAYWVNSDIFAAQDEPAQRGYPLGYGMAVAYPDTCSADAATTTDCLSPGGVLAHQLLSIEGQYLLSEVGLVPVRPIQQIRQFLARGMHDSP
ncbi:MAG: hypothetical protein AAF892_00145 [Cyanobacteria bacterium P01_D01_bin.71]